jgi:hypothetical protein
MDAVLSSMQNPLTDMEGMKTFLMGALTGALISPGAKVISKVNESISDRQAKKSNPNYQTKKEQAAENIALVNSMYKDPTQFKKEWIAAVKVNNKAADTMEEAARNHNKYVFYNAKDSAFAKTVSAAIKLDMFDSMRDVLKEYGNEMSDDEFKTAFGIDATDDNKKNVKNFTYATTKPIKRSKTMSSYDETYQAALQEAIVCLEENNLCCCTAAATNQSPLRQDAAVPDTRATLKDRV